MKQGARMDCGERKGTVSIATVEMRLLTSKGSLSKGQRQLSRESASSKSPRDLTVDTNSTGGITHR